MFIYFLHFKQFTKEQTIDTYMYTMYLCGFKTTILSHSIPSIKSRY